MNGLDDWSNSLSHHGIAGQKWGFRNGPPYPLVSGGKNVHLDVGKMTNKTKESLSSKTGKVVSGYFKRVGGKLQKVSNSDGDKKSTKNDIPAKSVNKKLMRVSSMSDAELKERITRLQLEKQYKELLRGQNQQASQNQQKGNNEIKKALATAAGNVIIDLTRQSLNRAGQRAQARQNRRQDYKNVVHNKLSDEAKNVVNRKSDAQKALDEATYQAKLWTNRNVADKNRREYVARNSSSNSSNSNNSSAERNNAAMQTGKSIVSAAGWDSGDSDSYYFY